RIGWDVLYPCCVASLNIPIVDDTIHILEFLLGDMSTPRVDLLYPKPNVGFWRHQGQRRYKPPLSLN
ncbi:MAG: hypothetical protein WB988_17715, partial [Candidatus Nitrosopolaris sp.]